MPQLEDVVPSAADWKLAAELMSRAAFNDGYLLGLNARALPAGSDRHCMMLLTAYREIGTIQIIIAANAGLGLGDIAAERISFALSAITAALNLKRNEFDLQPQPSKATA